jgi:DNA polymerase elongation subunit (family B)
MAQSTSKTTNKKPIVFRCIDFVTSDFHDDQFKMMIYGIDEKRRTYNVHINDFKPFLYIKVGSNWRQPDVEDFMEHLKNYNNDFSIKKVMQDDVYEYKLVKQKTLYDFDASKYYKFIYISCHNMKPIYKLKSLYYDRETQKLNKGVEFNGTYTQIYETMIPPLLRFFHIQNISPSGWIQINKYFKYPKIHKNTRCDIEIQCDFKNVISLVDKETIVPYKICSFDIEASSSHGDFPTPIKNYKKVAYDIVDYLSKNEDIVQEYGCDTVLKHVLGTCFGFNDETPLDKCYLKEEYDETSFETDFKIFISREQELDETRDVTSVLDTTIDLYFDNENDNGNDIGDPLMDVTQDSASMGIDVETYNRRTTNRKKANSRVAARSRNKGQELYNISSILTHNKLSSQVKIAYLMEMLDDYFPKIKGDYVTFIGSTFVNYGEEQPYLNHCICLNDTTNVDKNAQTIECYDNEKDVLVAWTNLIKNEDPDIIIGYNIFGFDYPFMYNRAKENDCVLEFLKLSRNKTQNHSELKETSIILASGAYDLKYPSMDGRLQIDVFTYMRKEFILPSYKLDYVSSYLISDGVKKFVNNPDGDEPDTCFVYTKNMKGISLNCYVHFEIINHSNDYYENGKKFRVIDIRDDGFLISGNLHGIDHSKVQWGLAKDDVTPQDIFRMTNEGPEQKGIIAKYCIQDCNLVHQIFQKIDIMTTYIEMSKICSVPISFLMMRGQGIKLTSYIAKKCREKNTLMPLISKGNPTDMYEGAIVLEPKCNLYLDNPVACVDYSSLYPSSIISENISHDSKVWTKEYDLHGNLIKTTGIVNARDRSTFKYDNLPGYKYVDIKYDTFGFKRDPENPRAKAKKVLTGYKICRFAQFPDGEKAIMPSILHELLAARKATKKQMAKETDPFMKNILDKRQLSIKVTANSLYGQTGAKTSTFYEMDVAASTTATGRKLLIYAREIIENVYKDMSIDTKYGPMITNAEYVYGDTDSVFFTFNLKDAVTGQPITGQKALEVTIEMAKEAGHVATKFLKKPHDLEYEKTFLPFCLLSKKRYVGMLYEEDPHKCKRKSMGIVLKRRDNAPIVKDVYGGIIDILMKDKDINKSIEFLKKMLNDIVHEKISMDKLIISKSLRSFYKNPQQIAHKVLADRMGVRDPGNKPGPGDRIPYVYILTDNKKDLQGNKIEHPDYIRENKMKIDYGFYISNQIMKPVLQIYSLVLYDMEKFKRKVPSFKQRIKTLDQNMEDREKFNKKVQQMKDKEVEKLLFEEFLRINSNKANNNTMITSFLRKR